MTTTGFEIEIDYSQAACADVEDPEIFFPNGAADHWDKVNEAKAICATCPVINQCFLHGVLHEKIGIWGGMTPSELAAYRKANNIVLEPLESDFTPKATTAGGVTQKTIEYPLISEKY